MYCISTPFVLVMSLKTVLDEVRVDTLKSAPGSRKRHKRKGRGISAGQGASCGFGMRGQKSRSGPGVRAGFEGGQMPLYRRIPKLVGRPMGPGHTKKVSSAKETPSTYEAHYFHFLSRYTLIKMVSMIKTEKSSKVTKLSAY